MRLLLIRHGQTPSNIIGALDTAIPGPGLTELGLEQAAAVPAALAAESIGAIFASTQLRAQLTAAPLAEARGLEVQVRNGLREVDAGELEMRTDDQAISIYMETVIAWADGDVERRMPGAENGAEVYARYDAVVDEAVATGHPTVAIVSHGAIIRSWVGARAENVSADFSAEHSLGNTGVVVLEGSPTHGWRALSWMGQAIGGASLDDAAHAGAAAETR
ncbi:histidine phosphatase family protein [Agreia sp. COWG]|uniref:histidine phosphatase family protein n=1 Tax=Agreia sp. COWG TaxID=2773266 RepID=UPI001928B1E1|nr:histidine phosphatase family protein [Agreia sp. COWG]CAD5991623.1 Histidine phosphatase family protein [Agreia sp. COWG]